MTYVEETVRPVPAEPARSRAGRRVVLLIGCVAVGMAGLDTAVVNVALPSIRASLGLGAAGLQWVVVAYALFLGGFQLLGGRLADRVGRRRVFLAGLAIFTVASLVSGAAQVAALLVVARAVQGLGAALMVPSALSLLAVTFAEGAERNRAIGIFGAVGGIAGTTGVVLGGLLSSGPGWRWAFWINVPVGVLLVVLALTGLPRDGAQPLGGRRLDMLGAVTVTGGLLAVVYALNRGATHGWGSASTLASSAVGVVLLAMFVVVERRTHDPLMPLGVWRRRALATASVGQLLASGALLGFIYLGSLLMQQVLGYSPLVAGVAWLATTATVFVVAVAAGELVAKVGVGLLVTAALVAVAAGALWLARVPAEAAYVADVMPAFLLVGVGFGLAGPALRIAAMRGAGEADAGLAAGMVETSNEAGGATGVAVVTTALVAAGGGVAGFRAGFTAVAVLAVVGVLVAGLGFRQRSAEMVGHSAEGADTA